MLKKKTLDLPKLLGIKQKRADELTDIYIKKVEDSKEDILTILKSVLKEIPDRNEAIYIVLNIGRNYGERKAIHELVKGLVGGKK